MKNLRNFNFLNFKRQKFKVPYQVESATGSVYCADPDQNPHPNDTDSKHRTNDTFFKLLFVGAMELCQFNKLSPPPFSHTNLWVFHYPLLRGYCKTSAPLHWFVLIYKKMYFYIFSTRGEGVSS